MATIPATAVPCTDPSCVHEAHELPAASEHEGRFEIEREFGFDCGYVLALSRVLDWKPGCGAPAGWFVELSVHNFYGADEDVAQLAKDLAAARTACEQANAALARQERLAKFPLNESITLEIEAMVADRGWAVAEIAERFGMSKAKLSSRLNGHTAWTAEDLQAVSEALVGDEWAQLIIQLFAPAGFQNNTEEE